MGKVRVTEKPGVWPYVLVNDFKNPPYFAYEVVNDDGSKRFVPVLNGGPEDEAPTHTVLNLTARRKAKIFRFLRNVLKNPSKFGHFMSEEWINELVKFLDLSDDQSKQATSHSVEIWLKKPCFQILLNDVKEKCPCTAEDLGNCTPTKSSAQMAAGKD